MYFDLSKAFDKISHDMLIINMVIYRLNDTIVIFTIGIMEVHISLDNNVVQ